MQTTTHFSLPPTLAITILLCVSAHLPTLCMQVKSYGVCHLLTGLFHFTILPQASSALQPMAGWISFSFFFFKAEQYFIVCFYHIFFLSFHSLIDIWVAFTSWLCGQYCCELGCEISLQDVALSSSGYVPKVDLLDLSAFSFKFGSSSTMD